MLRFPNDDDRWMTLVRRDRSADGGFSVRTSGVYCGPSCAARLARREQVSFHSTCEDGERAGFRPCKRCRPNEPALDERRGAAIAEACRLIESADERPCSRCAGEGAGIHWPDAQSLRGGSAGRAHSRRAATAHRDDGSDAFRALVWIAKTGCFRATAEECT